MDLFKQHFFIMRMTDKRSLDSGDFINYDDARAWASKKLAAHPEWGGGKYNLYMFMVTGNVLVKSYDVADTTVIGTGPSGHIGTMPGDGTGGGQVINDPQPWTYDEVRQNPDGSIEQMAIYESTDDEDAVRLQFRYNALAENDKKSSYYLHKFIDGAWVTIDEIIGTVNLENERKFRETKALSEANASGKTVDLKRLWKDYELLWILLIAGFGSAVAIILLMKWHKAGAPLPQGAS